MRRFIGLLLGLLPTIVGAQRVRGVVLDSALNSPLSGVVVMALDSASRVVGARTITDAAGRFTLAVPASAPKLRLMRIGFRLRDVPLSSNRNVDVRLSMERIPPILERVQVSDTELCPGSPDRGAAFQLWDQARSGLLAMIVARDAIPANARTVVYHRTLSASDEIVRKQTKEIKRGRTTNPFAAAASPDAFAKFGYMTEDQRGRFFTAPDADVLLHEAFALTHCFRLRRADDAHRGQIGVAFVPAPGPGRDTLVDVTGVIWMDAASPRLRTLDYTYTALEPAAINAGAGGHLDFQSMPNGVSFISNWVIRMPVLEMSAHNLAPGSSTMRRDGSVPPRWLRRDVRVRQIDESGGGVLEATWDDGTQWTDPPSILAGVVQGRRSNAPVTDAVVSLEGTDDSTRTDVGGEFDIETIPGRYFLRITDTAFKDFSKERTASQLVTVTRGAIETVRVEMPPVGDVLDDICRGRRNPPGSLHLAVYLAAADGTSLEGMRVEASWTQIRIDAVNGRMPVPETQSLYLKEEGRFVLCGVPPLRPIEIKLLKSNVTHADTTLTLTTVAPAYRLMWVVPPQSASPSSISKAVPPVRDSTPREAASALSDATKLAAFQSHRATALGIYLSDSVLSAVRGRPLVDVLPQLVRTLRVWRENGQAFVVAPSRTTEIPGFQSTSRCISDLYVDGVRRWASSDFGHAQPPNLASLSTDSIAAVEYYAADTRVADGLQSSPCGVLVLWRRG